MLLNYLKVSIPYRVFSLFLLPDDKTDPEIEKGFNPLQGFQSFFTVCKSYLSIFNRGFNPLQGFQSFFTKRGSNDSK